MMVSKDIKGVLLGVLISILGLFVALGLSYVEIAQKEAYSQSREAGLSSQISLLKQENGALKTKLETGEDLIKKYELLDRLISMSQLEDSKIKRAFEISEGTPLDFKTALILVTYAEKYKVQPSLILSVIQKESNFNGQLVGTSRDRGFMQIIPSTEKWLVETYGKELGLKYDPSQIFTPEYNLGLGIRYISELLISHTDPHRALSEYNRGEGRLASYYAANSTYQTGYSKTIVKQEKKYIQYNK